MKPLEICRDTAESVTLIKYEIRGQSILAKYEYLSPVAYEQQFYEQKAILTVKILSCLLVTINLIVLHVSLVDFERYAKVLIKLHHKDCDVFRPRNDRVVNF
jgi:hypothetical protein